MSRFLNIGIALLLSIIFVLLTGCASQSQLSGTQSLTATLKNSYENLPSPIPSPQASQPTVLSPDTPPALIVSPVQSQNPTPSPDKPETSKPSNTPSVSIPSVAPSKTATPTKIPSTPPASTTPSGSKADRIFAQMTLEEKVGQMFMPRCPDRGAVDLIKQYKPAGYVLYQRDFEGKNADQVRQTLNSYQQASDTPLLLSVDEEGGTVVRISRYPLLRDEPFKSPNELYKAGGISRLISDTQEKARLLLSLGVNVNLAPVCDVSTDPNDYMYKRSLGLSASDTAECIAAIVKVMEDEGISSALKHFPGYGNNVDTHTGIAIDKRPYSNFLEQDFLPFIAGIEQGAPSVLVSHNIIECMDDEYPASLSKEVHRVLRDVLDFDGVIMTDDLSMEAIKLYTNGQSPAVTAVLAGNDLLLTSDWEEDYSALLNAVKSGKVPVKQIDESVKRILEWKEDKGLL